MCRQENCLVHQKLPSGPQNLCDLHSCILMKLPNQAKTEEGQDSCHNYCYNSTNLQLKRSMRVRQDNRQCSRSSVHSGTQDLCDLHSCNLIKLPNQANTEPHNMHKSIKSKNKTDAIFFYNSNNLKPWRNMFGCTRSYPQELKPLVAHILASS